MAHDNDQKKPESPWPDALAQNPAPAPLVRDVASSGADKSLPQERRQPVQGRDFGTKFQAQVQKNMSWFMSVLPDNYVSQVNGPFYTLQFQAIAEAMARIQLEAQQITLDSDYDFTRSEFLWEMLGTLVFPGASETAGGVPVVEGDVTYREFLHRMVLLLLRGSTPDAVEEGAGLLAEGGVTIVEKFLGAREEGSAWTLDEQHEFEVNVETADGTAFPTSPFVLQENIKIILKALKPAHTLYEYRHLFRDSFGEIFSDDGGLTWTLTSYYYDDFRKFCAGAKDVFGFDGSTLTGRFLFSAPEVSFKSIREGAVLTIAAGPNEGRYEVREVVAFPMGSDSTARAYTTSPTGLSGMATVEGDVIEDSSQNFALAAEGEVLTFTEGPNAGSYRLDTLLGSSGGPIGAEFATGPATQVRVSPSILRLKQRMPAVATGQAFRVTVDRLGVREPKDRLSEDVSAQFYL